MKKYILTTGPSLLNEVPLKRVHSLKNIYRINGAHGTIEEIRATVLKIRDQIPQADILIDLPGNKVRTKGFIKPLYVEAGKRFEIPSCQFNYQQYYTHLKKGMVVWANDSTLKFVVEEANQERIVFLSESTGYLQNNKGMHVRGIHANIPFLFDKDKELIALCNEMEISFIGLSFVRTVNNIQEVKKLLQPADCDIISKIETKEAVENLQDILDEVSYILIDRGDLSTEIGIEKVPRYQKHIIEMALYNSKKVFLATQVLKNMEEKPIPTIAEINDLYTVFKMGVFGVQLSEETAVGKHVEKCVEILNMMDREVSSERLRM